MTNSNSTLRNDCVDFSKAIALPVILGTGLMATLLLSEWWPVDVVTERVVSLGALTTTNGEVLNLTQRFIGDGYLTVFSETNSGGRAWDFLIDGDARKAWKARLKKTNDTVEIALLGKRFFYDIQSHRITNTLGHQQTVREIPEDGSEPFFLGPQPFDPRNITW